MNITLDKLIELLEYSKVQIGYQSDETYRPFDCPEYNVTKYMDVIDASKLLEQLYEMVAGV